MKKITDILENGKFTRKVNGIEIELSKKETGNCLMV